MSEPGDRDSALRSDRGADREQRPKRGIWIAIIGLIVVACVVAAGILPRMKAKADLRGETNDLAVPTVSVIQPKQGAPAEEVAIPGNVQPFIDSPIYARTNGYLKKWYMDIGTHVKTGQLLAEIDTPEVDQQLQGAKSDLATAEANEKLAETTSARYQDLKSTDSVSKQDVDNAEGDFAAKRATKESAAANLKRLEDTQAFQRIYAPFDGVITARNTDVGDLINSGNGGAAQELFHIAQISKMRVFVNVPEQYSQAAKPGLNADLTLAEFPNRRFTGKLTRTSNSIDPGTRTLLVEVDVDNPTGELFPGAYAQVHLKLPNGSPVFILPVSALIFQTAGLQIATVDANNKAVIKAVTLGRDYGSEVEVVTGVAGDDKVITDPPDSIVDGELLRIATPKTQGQPDSAGRSR
jgi:RND family efflux transporter MFP subunit